ncbi:MAG: hypothetical protein ACREPR_26135, partial [Brasilonema sp.]
MYKYSFFPKNLRLGDFSADALSATLILSKTGQPIAYGLRHGVSPNGNAALRAKKAGKSFNKYE